MGAYVLRRLLATIPVMAVVAVFVFAVSNQDDADDVVTIVAPAVAAIAGLVGAYFGLRAGTLAARHVTNAVQQQAGGGQPGTEGSPGGARHGIRRAPEPTAGQLAKSGSRPAGAVGRGSGA